jgi:dolichyl-phosphate beta-glucosyltransferase
MTIPESRLTVVLPCFNEGAQISESLSTLDRWFPGSLNILVIDDGSLDDTFDRARAYASDHHHVSVHRIATNRGKGHAIRVAATLVRDALIVVMDADLAYEGASVARIASGLTEADMVVGNRRHRGSRYDVPVELFGFLYRRHLVGLAFNLLVRTVLPIRSRDTQCGLKGFRRDALQQLVAGITTDGFAFDVEMLLVARALGLRLQEVPVKVTYESAKSNVNLLRSAVSMGFDLARISLRWIGGRYAPARLRKAMPAR